MSYYLVKAKPKKSKLQELEEKLKANAFIDLQPFGQAVTMGLKNARIKEDGEVVWEEEDYCSPPLAMEREAVLDEYFTDIQVEDHGRGNAWKAIAHLTRLFPELDEK